ncbi:MAG: nucleoside triphosphate pyrophosphohydrolase [Alphaproteobacteria bacterium]|jgi:ATP diphosphatase
MTDNLDRLLSIMARLRDPETGCPWDIEQNFATIAPYTIEEAYEVADAIERVDMPALRDELGDLLLQVVFHARMAEEASAFAFDDVAGAIADKMERRHPHVFGDGADAELRANWENQKAAERAEKAARDGRNAGVLDDVPMALPALMRAEKLQKRAARVGFDWPETGPVFAKIDEEIDEVKAEIAAGSAPQRLTDELGDLLFACVNLARHLGVDPETALRGTNARFESRFRSIERTLAARAQTPADVDLHMLDQLWRDAKRDEAGD